MTANFGGEQSLRERQMCWRKVVVALKKQEKTQKRCHSYALDTIYTKSNFVEGRRSRNPIIWRAYGICLPVGKTVVGGGTVYCGSNKSKTL